MYLMLRRPDSNLKQEMFYPGPRVGFAAGLAELVVEQFQKRLPLLQPCYLVECLFASFDVSVMKVAFAGRVVPRNAAVARVGMAAPVHSKKSLA